MRMLPAPLSAPVAVTWPAPTNAVPGGAVTGRALAARIARFYAAHPAGRIVTDLVTRAREVTVFRAAVYRGADDAAPAATGWATSGAGVGPAFERAEDAAVGRALAHLGFGTLGDGEVAPGAPNVEAEAEDPAAVVVGVRVLPSRPRPVRSAAVAALATDVAALVSRAERYGLRPRRAAAWRAHLWNDEVDARLLAEAERRLRAWVERRRGEPYAGAV